MVQIDAEVTCLKQRTILTDSWELILGFPETHSMLTGGTHTSPRNPGVERERGLYHDFSAYVLRWFFLLLILYPHWHTPQYIITSFPHSPPPCQHARVPACKLPIRVWELSWTQATLFDRYRHIAMLCAPLQHATLHRDRRVLTSREVNRDSKAPARARACVSYVACLLPTC